MGIFVFLGTFREFLEAVSLASLFVSGKKAPVYAVPKESTGYALLLEHVSDFSWVPLHATSVGREGCLK